MLLILNTTIKDRIQLFLVKSQSIYVESTWSAPKQQSEKLLDLINKFLNQNKIKLTNLKGISVVIGPGAFSSLRLACITGNTLAYCLKIPIIGVKIQEYNDIDQLIKISQKKLQNEAGFRLNKQIQPFYGKEPNITKPKKK